jgi:hypothetical protein
MLLPIFSNRQEPRIGKHGCNARYSAVLATSSIVPTRCIEKRIYEVAEFRLGPLGEDAGALNRCRKDGIDGAASVADLLRHDFHQN